MPSPRSFSLRPFPGESPPHGLALSGEIDRRGGRLVVRYLLTGETSSVALPPRSRLPQRRDRLWEATCLELFVGAADEAGYLEFNLSPAGHWNVYRFDAYRSGMREAAAFGALPFRVARDAHRLAAVLETDLSGEFPADRAWAAGISAVVRSTDGGTSHWALAHPGARPDFHDREGFRIALPAEGGLEA